MRMEDCIFFNLAKASQTATRFLGQKIAPLHLTPVQAMVLSFLGIRDHLSSRDLGERTQLDSATLTGILDRLEGIGCIRREPNPNDRRAISICLTDCGRKLAREVHRAIDEANREFLIGLNTDEQRAFRRFLRRVRAHSPRSVGEADG